MFFDIGSLEFIVLIILAILVFGPEKLPKMIHDAAGFLRKIREFSDSAKADIRSELGPEFKDFEFEDLNPRTFAKKHLLDNDDLGLKEITSGLDMRKELTEVTDAVNGRTTRQTSLDKPSAGTAAKAAKPAAAAGGAVSLEKEDKAPAQAPPPFDADAT